MPTLAGLRYGFAQAFVAALGLHAFAYGYSLLNDSSPWPLDFGYSLGVLLVAMLAGEFRDIWEQRIDRLEQSNQYRQARMEEFTRAYHILKLSHDRLEQTFAGDKNSLRSALLDVRSQSLTGVPLTELATSMFDLLATYCNVQSATLLQVDAVGPEGQRRFKEVAQVGRGLPVDQTDVLITTTLARLDTTSVDIDNPEFMHQRMPGDPLVCVPLIDAYMDLHGLLVVTQLPFFAFTESNLQLLSLITGSTADFLNTDASLPPDLDETAADWLLHTRRCLINAREHNLNATVLALTFADATAAASLIHTITGETRGLDILYHTQINGKPLLLLLMPLTSQQGLDMFMVRLSEYLNSRHGGDAITLGVKSQHLVIDANTHNADLAKFVAQFCGVEHPLPQYLGAERVQRERAA